MREGGFGEYFNILSFQPVSKNIMSMAAILFPYQDKKNNNFVRERSKD